MRNIQVTVIFLVIAAFSPLKADTTNELTETTVFEKISLLRFAKEYTVFMKGNRLDLSQLDSNSYMHVRGKVKFLPGEWISPNFYSEEEFNQFVDRSNVEVPMAVRSYPYSIEGLKTNFGSFIIRATKPSFGALTANFPRDFHPMTVYIVTKNKTFKVFESGSLAKSPEQNQLAITNPNNIPLTEVDSDFYIIGHLSAPLMEDGFAAINMTSFFIGENKYLGDMLFSNRLFVKALVGSFLIIAVFYSFIYIFRWRDFSSLYLAIYAICSFSLGTIYVETHGLSAAVIVDLFTGLNVAAIAALQAYCLEKLKFRFSKKFIRINLIGVAITLLATEIALTQAAYVTVSLLFLVSSQYSVFVIFTTLYQGIRHRIDGIVFFTMGTTINLTFQAPLMMSYLDGGASEIGYDVLLANLGMAMCLALVNAKEFAATFQRSVNQGIALQEKNEEISFFNKNLEKLVDMKTREIRSLLDHIPQGVLSIGEDGIISKDYSAHLTKVIDSDEVANKSFKDLIFSRSGLSSDEIDQAWQTLLVSLGQDELNFEVNCDKLPGEIPLRTSSSERYLKATWSALTEDDEVNRVLVTLLDVTAEKEFEKEAEKQRKELELLQELLEIEPDKATQFFLTSGPLLLEIKRLIEAQSEDIGEDLIRILFVNAHTVKGAARTLGLNELSNVIHEMESFYTSILREGERVDKARMLRDIQASIDSMDKYHIINRDKLNRSDDYKKVSLERSFIEKNYYLIKELANADSEHSKEIIQALTEQSNSLTEIIFEQLDHVFDTYKQKAVKIAKDLSKASPDFVFELDKISLSSELRTTLDNCMIHLLRNSLDHGIEKPEERLQKGKPSQGCITLKAREDQQSNELQIEMSDDGKGLALQILRKKGLESGVLNLESTPQQIAESIFNSGVSTNESVSMYSGRGVGMDAVRTFLRKQGGDIKIKLANDNVNVDETSYIGFKFLISLPLLSEEDIAEAS